MLPDHGGINSRRQLEVRVHSDARVSRREVFFRKQLNNESRNFRSIEPHLLHAYNSLTTRALRLRSNNDIMHAAEKAEQWVGVPCALAHLIKVHASPADHIAGVSLEF